MHFWKHGLKHELLRAWSPPLPSPLSTPPVTTETFSKRCVFQYLADMYSSQVGSLTKPQSKDPTKQEPFVLRTFGKKQSIPWRKGWWFWRDRFILFVRWFLSMSIDFYRLVKDVKEFHWNFIVRFNSLWTSSVFKKQQVPWSLERRILKPRPVALSTLADL